MSEQVIYEPLRKVVEGCDNENPTSAVAFWTVAGGRDGLGFLLCITSDEDRVKIVKLLREHADALAGPPEPEPLRAVALIGIPDDANTSAAIATIAARGLVNPEALTHDEIQAVCGSALVQR